jgi:hypothetical protein
MKHTTALLTLAVFTICLSAFAVEVVVQPPNASVPMGGVVFFHATALEQGQPIPVNNWAWSVEPDSLGTICAGGRFVATHLGEGQVVAACVIEGETYTGFAQIHVMAGPPPPPEITVIVNPAFAMVPTGQEFHFFAQAVNAQGIVIPVNNWVWTVEPATLGIITEMGLFTAGENVGMGHVIASCVIEGETYTGNATVHVVGTPPPEIIVEVFPQLATIPVGGEIHFNAIAHHPGQPPIPVEEWHWLVAPAMIGTVSDSGVFTATTPGECHVFAHCVIEGEAYSGFAVVHVMEAPPPIVVTVTPGMAIVPINGTCQFIATARSNPNEPPIPVDNWVWSVEPESLGTITDLGLFTATHLGIGHVVATCVIEGETYTGSAMLNVVAEPPPPPPIIVSVCPWNITVPVGGVRLFHAWAHQPWHPPIPVEDWTWAVVPNLIGTISDSGVFVATAPGECHVIASCVIEGETYSGFAVVHVIGEPPPGGTISGTVTNETGEPIAGAHIRAFRINSGQSFMVITANTGAYELPNLPPGIYILRANAFGYLGEYWDNQPNWQSADEIEITGPETQFTADFELAVNPGGPYLIAGTIRDNETNPMNDAFVFARGTNGQLYFTTADENGDFAVEVPAGNYQVWSEFPNFGTQWFNHAANLGQAIMVEVGATPEVTAIDFDLIPVAVEVENPGVTTLITHYRLDTPYPNPFNPTTTLSYSLASGADVTLKVFDVLGREVATLINDHQAAGDYRIAFDASHLASGNYFVVLNASGVTLTRKILLIK